MNTTDNHLAWMRLRGLRPATINQRRDALRRLQRTLAIELLAATEDDLYAWALGLRGTASYRAMDLKLRSSARWSRVWS